MSASYYNKMWEEAIEGLLDCVREENMPLEEAKGEKGITNKKTDLQWFQYYAGLYIRYVQTYRQLEDSYDQIVHPQKRILMKDMLQNVIVRMCEVKQNLIRYSTHTPTIQSDFVNIDEILMDMKLTPKALRLPLPRYFLDGNTERDTTIRKMMKELDITEEVEVVSESVKLDTNLQTAIRIIQKLQRARQGIVRAMEYAKAKNRPKDRLPELSSDEDSKATIVQKYWRAFLARKELAKMRQNELEFLKIHKVPAHKSLLEAAEAQRAKLKEQQKKCAVKLEGDKENIKNQIKRAEELTIKTNMLDQRRKWINKFLEMHEFSNLPTNSDEFYKQKNGAAQAQATQATAEDDKKEKKQKKPDDKGKGKKTDADKFMEDYVPIGPTEAVLSVENNIKNYNETWGGTRDENEGADEDYDTDLAWNELRPGICNDLERLVDSIINLELDNMRIKYGIAKKKEKKAKKKAKKEKKIKIPQGLAKESPKNLLEDLFEKNVAKVLAPAAMEDFIGEHNPLTYLIEKNSQLMPDPSMAQVRNLVAEYVGIPLGSEHAKNKLEKWNWFMFYGAMGTGKTMIIRALQKETSSVLFDLSPDNLKDKYTEKSELTRLIWSIIICAKAFQPAIVMIDDFETIFSGVKGKKKQGTPNFGPKIKKIIGDMKKNKLWSKNDRIAVIGCSNKPYDASLKDCKKLFDKKIYFPYPNYATRKLMAKHFVEQKTNMPLPYFPYETVAQVSEGYTAGSFKQCVEKVLTPLRVGRLKDEPLKLSEFVNPLSNSPYVFSEVYEKLRKFTDEVSGLKERREQRKETTQEDKKDKGKPKPKK